MSSKIQTSKNIALTNKLIDYLVYGENVPNLPLNVSFVPFSKSDKVLNNANSELLKSLLKDKSPVAKAEEPKTSKGNWKIIPANF